LRTIKGSSWNDLQRLIFGVSQIIGFSICFIESVYGIRISGV